jgi:solute:Na+ symporter, SSS family
MYLTTIDWLIIAAYFVLSLGIGLYYYRRAGESTAEFFVAGRSLPWWLAGTSMVATTFAADTPLAVTEMVARNGVAGNWLWWSMLPSGMLTVFFFARLWRRAEVVTDVEFVELRYSGRPAAFLRAFRSLYLGLAINLIIMGWVNLGMVKVLSGTLGLQKWQALAFCLSITLVYSSLSGLWGVVVTDAVQFVIAMGGSIVLAVLAVQAVGGLDRLKAGLEQVTPLGAPDTFGADALSLWSDGSAAWMLPLVTLVTYLGVNWWASWYPGAEPGGGGYIAQRIFSARDEKHGVLATLWFNVAHYALRPWPWIIVALCSLVLYGGGAVNPATGEVDPAFGYVRVMNEFLPAGFRGLLLASFAAAYMSTIATQLNWGSSYLVNDFYRRFVRRDAGEAHYVAVSRAATVLTVALSAIVTYFMNRITGGWELVLTLGAGTGLVYILRWYWWRINAWSEIAAMAAALVVSLALRWSGTFDSATPLGFAKTILTTVAVTTAVWVAATFATAPEPDERLVSFYRRVRPAGPGWRGVATLAGAAGAPGERLAPGFVNWVLGIAVVYATLFGTGEILFGAWTSAGIFTAVAVATAALLARRLETA